MQKGGKLLMFWSSDVCICWTWPSLLRHWSRTAPAAGESKQTSQRAWKIIPHAPCQPWDHRAGSQGPRQNDPSKESLPSFPRLRWPSTPALRRVRSRQGVLLPNPSGLQDLGWWVWWELRAQQDLWKQIALALRYGEQDLLGWVVSAVGIAHWRIGCLAHCTERRGLVLVPSFLDG